MEQARQPKIKERQKINDKESLQSPDLLWHAKSSEVVQTIAGVQHAIG
jgi:hypothetical protein